MTYTVFDVDSRTLIGRGLSAQESHDVIFRDSDTLRHLRRVTDEFSEGFGDDHGWIDMMITAMVLRGRDYAVYSTCWFDQTDFTDVHKEILTAADLKGYATVSVKRDGKDMRIDMLGLVDVDEFYLLHDRLDELADGGCREFWTALRLNILAHMFCSDFLSV